MSKVQNNPFAERELEQLRFALDQSAIVAITDAAGNITYVNDKFCQISRYSRAELIGQNHRIINSGFHPSEFFSEMWKTIACGKVWEGEIKNRAKGGEYYWVNTCIVPFLDSKQKPYQYVSIRYEITQRKLAEEQLLSYSNKLERSNQELQDFASVAAHDLQEPLRKIQAFSDRLQKKEAANLSPEGNDYLERMKNAANRMQTLIQDLLSFARVNTKGSAFIQVNLDTIIQEVLADLEVLVEQTQAKFDLKPLGEIEADPTQMRQLFQNLIGNALKFRKPQTTPFIEIFKNTNEFDHTKLTISVRDNGIGFDEKYLDKIFTIFQRLHGRQEYPGTGVGLALCRRIVERHGGSISGTSVVNQGATFTFSIPKIQINGGSIK